MDQKTIQRLVELRQNHGYSQERLALELGVSRQAISNWERGEAAPDTDNLIALAKLYGSGLDTLLGLEVAVDKPDADEKDRSESDEPAVETADTDSPPKKKPGRKLWIALFAAIAVVIGVGAIWLGSKTPPSSRTSALQQTVANSRTRPTKHYEISGEIVASEPSYLGVQYVVKGAAWSGDGTAGDGQKQLTLLDKGTPKGTADVDALYAVFVSADDTQFLDEQGKETDNNFLALKEGTSVSFTLNTTESTLPALAKAETVQPRSQ